MKPEDIKKLRLWSGQSQKQAAESIGVRQSTWSGVESGQDTMSQRTIERYIAERTPIIFFIKGERALLVAQCLQVLKIARGAMVSTAEALKSELKKGGGVIVITDKPKNFIDEIEKAKAESGLKVIPLFGLDTTDSPVEWLL